MSDAPARSRRRLSDGTAAAAAPAAAASDGADSRPRKKPGRKPATSVLCQVAGCGKELLRPGATAGRDYYSRYRICREHCIMPQLTIDGKVQRFCQQHGRFHDLDKFEPHRRSCIAALSHHRQRRRTFGGKPVGRGQPGATKQGSDAEQPPQPPQQQGQRAAAMAVHTVPPNTPSQSLGCAPCDSEAATPATPVCFAGEKGSRWQGASFAPRLAAAPAEPARPALTVAAVAAASPGQPAAGGSAALQPAAGVQPAASGGDMRSAAVDAVAELELLFDEQPQLSSISHSEEMADRWLTEVLFEGAPADVKSPYDALLVSDVW